MTDLAAWLLEQIAEDERVAEAEDRDYAHTSLLPTYDSDHQQRWSTDRVRAECDSKRKVLHEHRRRDEVHLIDNSDPPRFSNPSCAGCGFDGDEEPRTAHVDDCPTLRAVALAYADCPGYREEWRP